MVSITYVVVLPVGDSMSTFQGWHRDVMAWETLSILTAVTMGPFDTAEIFMSQESLIEYRKTSSGRIVKVIGGHLIESIPNLVESPMAIILYPKRYSSDVSRLVFPEGVSAIFATTGEVRGAINLEKLENRFSVQNFDYEIYKKIKNARVSAGILKKMPKLRSAYKVGADLTFFGAGTTIANEFVLASLGYDYPDTEYINPLDNQNYFDAIASGAETVLDVLKNDGKRGVVLYSPAIVSELYNTGSHRWNQLLREIKRPQHRNFIKNALIKNPGYSGYIVPEGHTAEDHPNTDPLTATILNERQKELKATNYSVALLASSLGVPAIRLPNSVNLQMSSLREIERLHDGWGVTGNKKLQSKFKALSDGLGSAFSERFKYLLKKRIDGCVICSDSPLEWAVVDDLPLMISHEVCRIPMTPGNMLLQFSAVGSTHELPVEKLRNILVIRSFKRGDKLEGVLQRAVEAFPMSDKISVKFVDVCSVGEVVAALNEYSGGMVIFDCHGHHDGISGVGWLSIGDEQLNTWTLHGVARIPPIVALSACSTSSIAGSYVSVANGFMRCGALSVIGTYLPVDGLHSSAFMARIIFRIDMFLSYLQHNEYELISWRLFISHFMRMSYATDVLMHFVECDVLTTEDYASIHAQANELINDFDENWYEFLIGRVAEISGSQPVELKRQIREDLALTESMLYCHLGRPDLLNIILN